MAEYFYAKVEKTTLLLAEVPSVFNAGQYALDVSITGDLYVVDDSSELPVPLETQAYIPFSMKNEELGLSANFSFVFRFTDGMFSTVPQVQIKTEGEYPGTYYILADEPISAFQ